MPGLRASVRSGYIPTYGISYGIARNTDKPPAPGEVTEAARLRKRIAEAGKTAGYGHQLKLSEDMVDILGADRGGNAYKVMIWGGPIRYNLCLITG